MYPKSKTKPSRLGYGKNFREKSRKGTDPIDKYIQQKRPTTTGLSPVRKVNLTADQYRLKGQHELSSPSRWQNTLNSPRESTSNLKSTPCSNIILPCSSGGCIIDPRLLISGESASKLGTLEEFSIDEFQRKCSAAKKSTNFKNMLFKHFENRGLFKEVGSLSSKDFMEGPYMAGYSVNPEKIGKIITESKVHNIHLLKKLEERRKIKSSLSVRRRNPL